MKCMFGVLAVASLCLARPEADPAILLTHPADAHPLPLPVAAHHAPLFAHPAPVLAHSAPVLAHSVVAHPAPVFAHAVQPLVHHVAPVAPVLPVAHAVAHAPLVKSVVELPAEVSHEVVAHPVFHHIAPVVHHAPLAYHHAPLAVAHHAPLAVAHHAVDPVALTHGAVHQVTPFLDLGRKKREADAEADAEADPYAYHYSSVSTPYAHYGTFVPDQIPHHPVVAHVAAPVHHGYYGGYPYAGYYGRYGYPYYG